MFFLNNEAPEDRVWTYQIAGNAKSIYRHLTGATYEQRISSDVRKRDL